MTRITVLEVGADDLTAYGFMGSGEAVVVLCRRYLVRKDLIEVGVKG
jgi:hypothetical protein